MTAHRRKLPRKSGFHLLLANKRLITLDVSPARAHNNRALGASVEGTHWHVWPCDEAEPDAREMPHRQWFHEFLSRARISFDGRYTPPPYQPEQMKLI